MPIVSIIIPVYKVEKYLRRCLDSVLAQTFPDWEAICVDDRSPDNSAAILAEYAVRDKRIKVVNHDANGGLSVARNTGLGHAAGEYVIYVDSDDSIHPQMIEIALALAKRDGSDIVAYTYDRFYRPQLMLRHKLGLNIDSAMPAGATKKYRLEKIKSMVTDDVFAHATERSHTNIKNPIKHCQVWKFMVRREFLDGIEFIPGIVYEDLPWWMSLMLKRPRVTITQLPLYYYFPNFGSSILLSYKLMHKLADRLTSLVASYKLYRDRATPQEMETIQREFLWQFYIHSFREVKGLDKTDREIIRKKFAEMNDLGMFNNPPNARAKKYRERILKFVR
jgi:glycosyltransferase involved in cell wall biosynthesis